jgi:TnpA family transposase
VYRPIIRALQLVKDYVHSPRQYYPEEEIVPIKDIVRTKWRDLVVEKDDDGIERVNRINYEVCLLQALREKVRSKEIWVVGANRFRNYVEDLPTDFEGQRKDYYEALKLPSSAQEFTDKLQTALQQALRSLDAAMPRLSPKVKILPRRGGWIHLSPLEPQSEPPNLARLKLEVATLWPMTGLLDVLKETDLRVSLTDPLTPVSQREILERELLQKRLLLCLYGLGTNTGLKRLANADPGTTYQDLRYVRSRYIHKEQLRNAIAVVANAIFSVRRAEIWGEGTTACASDSKKFGAWDQNLLTEWHIRYRGPGIMVYWHVEKKATCIYSQVKSCSSSEVAAMIEGILRHCTDAEIQKNFVDSHGQSEIAFAFCQLLGFRLLPRLKDIGSQRLYRAEPGTLDTLPNLQLVLSQRAINWELIRNQYDEMIKYATALRLGTADAESILRRFTRNNVQHPTYQALAELGKAVKTIFLCEYLQSEELRREIHEGLNVVENWNSANGFIFYGKGGEIATNRLDEQEIAILSLHLLQICLVYVNTLMIQQVLSQPAWENRLTVADYRGLTPLFYQHINPYGTFRLDMKERIVFDKSTQEAS